MGLRVVQEEGRRALLLLDCALYSGIPFCMGEGVQD